MSNRIEFLSDWDEKLSLLPPSMQDVYFLKAYHELYSGPEDSTECFFFSRGKQIYLLPYILRKIPNHLGLYDIESAYGYGGPLSNSNDPAFLQDAFQAFHAETKKRGVCAAFLRLHPLLQNSELLPEENLKFERSTVSVPLEGSSEGLLQQMDKTHRYEIRQADKRGVRISFHPCRDGLDKFKALYEATLDRLKASEFYYFPSAYYRQLQEKLAKEAFLSLAHLEGKLVAGAIFLRSGRFGHYHLNASTSEHTQGSLFANKLLMYQSMVKLSSLGLEQLHLGGGRSADRNDSLFKFKLRFSGQIHDFHTARLILDREVYGSLCKTWEEQNEAKVKVYGRFFLKYRY